MKVLLAGGYLAPKSFYKSLTRLFPSVEFVGNFSLSFRRNLPPSDIFIGHSLGCIQAPFCRASEYILICPPYGNGIFNFLFKEDVDKLEDLIELKNPYIISAIFDPFFSPHPRTSKFVLTHWSIKSSSKLIKRWLGI